MQQIEIPNQKNNQQYQQQKNDSVSSKSHNNENSETNSKQGSLQKRLKNAQKQSFKNLYKIHQVNQNSNKKIPFKNNDSNLDGSLNKFNNINFSSNKKKFTNQIRTKVRKNNSVNSNSNNSQNNDSNNSSGKKVMKKFASCKALKQFKNSSTVSHTNISNTLAFYNIKNNLKIQSSPNISNNQLKEQNALQSPKHRVSMKRRLELIKKTNSYMTGNGNYLQLNSNMNKNAQKDKQFLALDFQKFNKNLKKSNDNNTSMYFQQLSRSHNKSINPSIINEKNDEKTSNAVLKDQNNQQNIIQSQIKNSKNSKNTNKINQITKKSNLTQKQKQIKSQQLLRDIPTNKMKKCSSKNKLKILIRQNPFQKRMKLDQQFQESRIENIQNSQLSSKNCSLIQQLLKAL